jgi:predicted patatin/cPLA2 family phospholipase
LTAASSQFSFTRACRGVESYWGTGEYKSASGKDPNFALWVLASSSYPVMFLPVKIDGSVYTDGGARTITPLEEAVNLGAKEIDVVLASDPEAKSDWDPAGKKVPEYLFRFLDIVVDEVMRSDLKCMGIGNDFVDLKAKYRDVKIRVMKPKRSMSEFSSLDFDPIKIRKMIEVTLNWRNFW